MTTPSTPIKFFDISPGDPKRTYAPNPWKTRLALNYKGVNYETEWVAFKDIEATRKAHGLGPVRKYPDGTDFYTLPFIYDASTDTYVGDTLDIAVYLDKQYPELPRLIPANSIGIHRAFNTYVDPLLVKHSGLGAHNMPFTEEEKALFCKRWHMPSWEITHVLGEARGPALKAFENDMEEFAKLYRFDDGPFLEGKTLTYADFIVGAWLAMMKGVFSEDDWALVCGWQGGRWGRFFEALKPWTEMK